MNLSKQIIWPGTTSFQGADIDVTSVYNGGVKARLDKNKKRIFQSLDEI